MVQQTQGIMYSFFLPMKNVPSVTHQEKSIRVVQKSIVRSDGKAVKKPVPVVYEDERLKDARRLFMGLLKDKAPEVPFEGPIQLITKWIWNNSGSKHRDGEWKITKPDTDNVIKLFKDCMTRSGFWEDDAQVCSEITQKFWGEVPGVFVVIESLRENRD